MCILDNVIIDESFALRSFVHCNYNGESCHFGGFRKLLARKNDVLKKLVIGKELL